jgi:hypothetical protein
MDKFKRTIFYKTENVYGQAEQDLAMNYWDLFITKRPISFYTITYEDIQRPELISLKVYGDIRYWWILGKFNHIDDFWNDIVPEQTINCFHKTDADDWLTAVKRAKINNG